METLGVIASPTHRFFIGYPIFSHALFESERD
jgi:hypothetical protein